MLNGDGLEPGYVTDRLSARAETAAVAVESRHPLGRQDRFAQLRRRYTWTQLVSRAGLAIYKRMLQDSAARHAQLDAVLGSDSRAFRNEGIISRFETVNRPESHELVEQLQPSRLIVYGTGMVGDRMIARSRLTALNLHTGISPYYRGSSCAFWPIHNGEPEMCGATVHEICSVVDGGAIYATTTASLDADDGLHAVFARTVVAGAALYADTLADLALAGGDPPGRPQDLGVGTEYRAHMRGLRAEMRARRQLRRGLLDPSGR